MSTRQAYLSMDHWDIADTDMQGKPTGKSKQYTHINVLAFPKKIDENQFGHQVVKFNCDKPMFDKMRQLSLEMTNPIPCTLDIDLESGKDRKAKMQCTDIEFEGQSLLYDNIDITKLPKYDSSFKPLEQLQGAIQIADKTGYDFTHTRIIPLFILGMTKRTDKNGIDSAQVYIASRDVRPNTAQHLGLVLTKGDANPALVSKLKQIVSPEKIKLKPLECIGICYPRRGAGETDNFYLADIFLEGGLLLQNTTSTSTQKKSGANPK